MTSAADWAKGEGRMRKNAKAGKANSLSAAQARGVQAAQDMTASPDKSWLDNWERRRQAARQRHRQPMEDGAAGVRGKAGTQSGKAAEGNPVKRAAKAVRDRMLGVLGGLDNYSD